MPEERKCPQCGASLPSEGWEGLCPKCLVRVSLDQPPGDQQSASPPEAAGTVSAPFAAVPETEPLPNSETMIERPGMIIGRYKLLQQIGEGGFGVVFMAEQMEPVQRKVAFKVIKAGMDTREVIARFEAERQALALMDHPNIARVLDGGATASGRPFFVMELVRGAPITEYCDQCTLNTRERLELFIQVCRAVHHAHQKGLIHRDLKPSNVLVTLHDGEPVPKVIDFGVAKALGQKLTDKTLFTRFEQMIGTPAYMSPEQAALSGLDIDTRSDIYSLGVLLYELLTGATPFDRELLARAALDEIRQIIRETEPPKPSTRLLSLGEKIGEVAKLRRTEPAVLSRLVRGDLDWITMKAMEKDRRRRYETVNGLAADIERHLNDQPVVARPPSPVYRFQKLVRRNKLAFASASAVTAALIIGLGVSTWLFIKERRTRGEAEAAGKREAAQRRAAQAEARRADAMAVELKLALAASDFLQAVRLISQDGDALALAYLVRCLTLNPTNEAAKTRLATLLAYRSWMLPILTLQHTSAVMIAHFSLDGKRILTAEGRSTVRVWDAWTGQPLNPPLQYGDRVLSFAPNGERIVTTSLEGTVWVRDRETGQPIGQPLRQSKEVISAQFSSDGTRIVTAAEDGSARVWDAQTSEPLTGPLRHDQAVVSAQFSQDGRQVVTASLGGFRVWDAQTGRAVTGNINLDGAVSSAQFSPSGDRLVTVTLARMPRIWDAHTGQPLAEPLKQATLIWTAMFARDEKRILTASWDKTARIWDAEGGQPLIEPLSHSGPVSSAEFSPDGARILTASQDTTACVWEARPGAALTEPIKHSGRINFAKFSPDGQRLVTASVDGTARVWDAQTCQPLTEPLRHASAVISAQFSTDGQRILTASLDGTARVWDARTGRPVIEPLNHATAVASAQFSPNGKHIVTVSQDGSTRVWDAQTGQPLNGAWNHSLGAVSARFSPDGNKIVTASNEEGARVWDARTGQLLAEPLRHNGPVLSAQFSPDGTRIVTASFDRTARVWDAQTGQPLTRPMDHAEVVESAEFSPDGKRIVTASRDGSARLWDAQTGQPLLQPLSHRAYVETAQFSSDGKRILTASLDGTAHVWDAETGHPLTEPLKHFWGQSAQFSPDGTRVVTWSAEGTARIWDIAPSPTRHPEWLLPLAEALSGKRVGPQGVVEETWSNRIAVVHQVQEALSRTNAPADDWVLWGRWLLADRSTRTISPFSKVTVQQYIDNRIKEQTVASLDEAETLAAGNPNLSFRVSQARRALDETNRPVLVQREDVALVSQGRLAEAEAAQRELLAIRKRLLGEEHRDVVTPPGDLARGFREQGKIVEADSLQRESLATRDEVSRRDSLANARKTWPDDPEKWVISLNKQVDVLLRERKYPEAEQLFKELTAAIESRPGSVGLLRSRATFRARSGRWQEAAADFSRLVVVQPENHDGYHCLAPLLVRTGDLEGYRRQCAQVLARFGPTQSPFIAERMTKLCLILPSSGVDLGAVDQMAETAVTVQETNHYLYYFQFAKGFAEHRQGHFSSSVEWIQKMLPKAGAVPFLDAEAHLVLAMAQHRLKHENEAHAALARGVEIVDTKLPRLDSGDIGPSWTDWIIVHALLGEARGLIEGHGPVSTDNAVKPNK